MKILFTTLFLATCTTVFSQSFDANLDAFLSKHVINGRVNYKAIKAQPSQLNALINQIGRAPIYSGNQEKAFLINAYNLLIIKGIIDHYPVKSPLDIKGFFDTKTFTLRGNQITLDKLEKELLYAQFPDARLHFVLVCAALSCPPLAPFAYTANQLEAQLHQQTQKAITNPEFIRVNGAQLHVSQLFKWYAADFGGTENIAAFIQKYHYLKVKFNPEVSFYPYNWNLNSVKEGAK